MPSYVRVVFLTVFSNPMPWPQKASSLSASNKALLDQPAEQLQKELTRIADELR
jgi:hypothetical protein